jgi:beta-lactamase class A
MDLAATFEAAGARGFLHARDLATGAETGLDSGELVVLASVFKIPVLLELVRRFAAGDASPTDRLCVTPAEHTLGSTGLSAMSDDVELSLRDLAYLMMSVSDNTATDVIMRRLGLDGINATLASLGLSRTVLVGDCSHLLGSFTDDTGIERSDERRTSEIEPELLRRWRSLDPHRTSRSTPREMTKLLELIWTDSAGPPEACGQVRRIMAQQVWPHRLTSGFPDGVQLAAKTGTLPGIRNEAGVVTYPDGSSYAVAVFTRANTFVARQPAIDASIGRAAFAAVEALRA